MVQLKENCSIISKTLSKISIPYGSIKSELHSNKRHAIVEFQFLMVQLKAFCKFTPRNSFVISIPYGSIKSQL